MSSLGIVVVGVRPRRLALIVATIISICKRGCVRVFVFVFVWLIRGADCTRKFGVVRVCARTDPVLGRWEALSPCLSGPNQFSADNHFEITFHG